MKKLLVLALAVVILISALPLTASAADAYPISECGGTIVQGRTYSISTAEEFLMFQEINNTYTNSKILLNNDITINDGVFTVDENLTPLYNGGFVLPEAIDAIDRFEGAFDGQGHTIRGLYVKGEDYAGLFEKLGSKGTVKNLSIENSLFTGKGQTGSFYGMDSYDSRLEKCFSDAIVIGSDFVGGIVGAFKGDIQSCYFNGIVIYNGKNEDSDGFVGGIAGAGVGDIGGCANAGTVYGGDAEFVGGFAGVIATPVGFGSVALCSSTGDVFANNEASGFAAEVSGDFADCFAAGNVYAEKPSMFTGYVSNGSFASCYFVGDNDDTADFDGRCDYEELRPVSSADLKRYTWLGVLDTGCENHGYPIYHKLQRRTVAPSITNVEYTKSYEARNTFDVTVNGRPAMIQFIEPSGGTRTYNRNNANVTIKSYDADGNEVNSLDRTAAYEVWSIYSNMMTNVEIRTRAKYLSDARYTWDTETYDFPMILANPIVSMELSATSGAKGAVPATVVADEKTEKIMFKMPNGTSVTVSNYTTDENGNHVFTGKAWMNEDGLNEIKVYIRRDNVWKLAGILEYTVA